MGLERASHLSLKFFVFCGGLAWVPGLSGLSPAPLQCLVSHLLGTSLVSSSSSGLISVPSRLSALITFAFLANVLSHTLNEKF